MGCLLLLTYRSGQRKITNPVPLKHRTESAFLLLLAVVICVTGALIALLPPYPQGMTYWWLLAILAVLYPLSLHRMFRVHRADYEFRLLHWFPLFMLCLWLGLAVFDASFAVVHILSLGFFVLWSLPLTFLGIVFLALFVLHVLRRRTIRLVSLSLVLVLFAAGGIISAVAGYHDRLSARIFPPDSQLTQVAGDVFSMFRTLVGVKDRSPITGGTDESSLASLSSASRIVTTSASSSRPRRLAGSGPEDVVLIGLGLSGALYLATLHRRAVRRA